MRRRPQHFLFAAFLVLFGIVAHSVANDQIEQLRSATEAYKRAEAESNRSQRLEGFRQAELLFARLVNSEEGSIRNADLQTNHGTAALRAEHLGNAVLSFHRALLIDPDHRQAGQNLRYARSLLPEWVPRPASETLLSSFFAWSTQMTEQELLNLSALSFLAAAALVAASILYRRSNLRYLAALPAITWIALLTMALAPNLLHGEPLAVIVAEEVNAKTSDSANSPNRFAQALPGGTEVHILEERKDWTHVRLADGRDAWLPSSSIEAVLRR